MHIGTKILNEIEAYLEEEYSIDLDRSEWASFEQSLPTTSAGEIILSEFKERQQKAVEIVREILRRHRKDEIVLFLDRLAGLETAVQELEPWVRDHVVHALNTFLIGVNILKNVTFPGGFDCRYPPAFMWKLCGPTHDLGYPLEIARHVENLFVQELNSILEEINVGTPKVHLQAYPSGLGDLCGRASGHHIIEERLHEWGLDIDVYDYYQWLEQSGKVDHGVIGALAQLKVLDAIYQENNPWRTESETIVGNLSYNQANFRKDIVSACASIFVHNISPHYPGFTAKLDFGETPMAFLLYLSDNFQEWDRYTKDRDIYSGDDFDIDCEANAVHLTVPSAIAPKVQEALELRLSGLTVTVNGTVAVS